MPYPIKDKLDSQLSSSNFEVHTMPQKFLPLRSGYRGKLSKKTTHQKLSLKKNLIIGLVVILIVGLLMFLAAWLFMRSFKTKSTSPVSMSPNTSAVNNQAPPANLNQSSAQPATKNSGKTAKQSDDLTALLDVSNWQVHTDEIYNYSIKYPADWLFMEATTTGATTTDGIIKKFNLQDKDKHLLFDLTILDNPQQLTLEDWLSAHKISLGQLNRFTLDGQLGYKLSPLSKSSFNIFIAYASNIYRLTFYQTDDKTLSQFYNKLLTNFKFLKAETNNQTKPSEALKPSPALDSDQDGLTDAEEALYQTDKTQADTDKDGYSDGDEVANLYDPLRPGSYKLFDSKNVSHYINSIYHYDLLYPRSWQVKGNDAAIIFQAADGEFIQILVYDNQAGYADIYQWYQANVQPDTSQLSKLEINGISAIRSADAHNVYFIFNHKIYNLVYNIGLRQTASFMTTFNMLLKSFRFTAAN